MLEGENDPVTWEQSKENILPLKQGRKANVLSVALDNTATPKLNAMRHEFEEELRTYTGDDPLDVWYRYALWVEQNYPKGGKDGNLLKLIQKCVTNIYSNAETNEKYKNDGRFLTLWVKYASLCPNPLEIYGVLESKGLCTELAEFYISWSWEFEKLKNYRKAESIYQKGLQNGGLPLDVLQDAHRKFQTRVARATIEDASVETETSDAEHQRTALTALKVQGHKNRAPNERLGANVLGPAGRVSTSQVSANAGGPAFCIYQDNGAGGEEAGAGSKGGSLPVGSSVHKENIKNPSQWTKVKASQKTTGVVPVEDVDMYQKPAFSVHQDAGASVAFRTPSKLPEMSNVLSVRKNVLDDDWQVPLYIAEPFDPKFQPQYCKDKVYCGTEEFSFEELRAARFFKQQKEEELKKEEEELRRLKEEELQEKEVKKNAQIQMMQDMLKKQEEMIQQLLKARLQEQAVIPPEVMVTSPVETEVSHIAIRRGSRNETKDRSMYHDSWISMNKSVGVSINASINNTSHFLDENSTQALLQLKPVNLTPVIDELEPASNVSGQDISNSSHSNSKGLNVSESTVNTKLAMRAINDMWSGSLFKDDSSTISIDEPASAKESAAFTIYQDSDSKQGGSVPKNSSQPFSIYSDVADNKNAGSQASMPFAIYEDMPPIASQATCAVEQEELYADFQDENKPPVGYKQGKDLRPLAGVLQAATNVAFMPLEEQMEEDEKHIEKDEDGNKEGYDLEDIVPLNGTSMADFTLKMPCNPEAFAKMATVASTPAPWSLGEVPQATVSGDDYTMAVLKFNDHYPLVSEDIEENKSKEENSGELMPPPVVKRPPTTPPEYKAKPVFSPIMETSREYRSSSSSSGNSITSTTLGASLPNGITQSTGFLTSQTLRSRHCSNPQSEWLVEPGASSQTGDFTKSGYLADRSRGESLADSRPNNATYQNTAPVEEEMTFDPRQAAAALLEMEGLPSASPVVQPKMASKGLKMTAPSKIPSIKFPEKINPFDDVLIGQLLSSLDENVESRGGFVQVPGRVPVIKPNMQVTLGQEFFHIRRLRGEGAYAKVYQAATLDPMNVTFLPTVDDDEEEEDDEMQMILKIQKPTCPWEFYICHELRQRLKANSAMGNMLDSVMRINRGYFFSDGSILVNQYHKYGTLLEVVNGYKATGTAVPEEVIMVYMVEVLTIIEALHNCQIIHADIKPDNFLVRDTPQINVSASSPEEMFDSYPCSLKLIDFGRSIDMKLLPEGTMFTEKVTTEGFTCCEMREGLPWTYQTDLYGIAAIAYCFLFGSYMDVKKGPSGKWELKGATMKRYWQRSLWKDFFTTLLNVPSCSALPSLSKLKKNIMTAFFEKKMAKEIEVKFKKLTFILIQKK